ncbi:hypothetical protein CSOJ01_10929 [Colletotrichum sojae]|uniref:Uncharacterized protein n=1 Tax=Colletotrichum sojae TaxID=2175907 RepID=A0A8H6IZK5_9PEZI|nr:hypothetical protein CSOJ01_10929 [Colletotrichum sojae]
MSSIGRSQNLDAGAFGADITGSPMMQYPVSGQQETFPATGMIPEYDLGALSAIWEGFSDLSSAESEGEADRGDSAFFTIPWKNTSSVTMFGRPNYTKHEIPVLNLSISNYNGLGSGAKGMYQSAKIPARAAYRPDNTVSFGNLTTLIISHAMLHSSQRFRNGEQKWEDSEVTAEECALYFCTNIYKSEVKQSVLEETALGSYTDRNFDTYVRNESAYGDGLSKAFNQHVSHSIYIGRTDWMRTDLQLVIAEKDVFDATGARDSGNLYFNISYNTAGSPVDYFVKEFSRPLVYGDQMVYSNYPPERPPEPFTGVEKQWVVRIRVNWEYLALPIFALLGGCVFCLVSIVETQGLGLPAWRGSSLATLAYGLDAESRDLLRHQDDIAQLDGQARALKVKFVDSEKGPQLVQGQRGVC